MIIFLGEGFFVFLVLLGFLAIFGLFGSAYALLQVVLEHWYILLIAMIIKGLIDYFLYSKIANKTKTRSIKEKKTFQKARNQVIITNTMTNVIIFISMCLFLYSEMKIINDHMFLSIVYGIIYLAGIFGIFLSTCLNALTCMEKAEFKLENWIGGTLSTSPINKLKKMQVLVCVVFAISLIIPSFFLKFVVLCASTAMVYYICIESSFG